MKEVAMDYYILDNRCDILDPRENVVVSGFDEEIFISVGGMNVWSRFWIEILKGLYDRCVWRVNYI